MKGMGEKLDRFTDSNACGPGIVTFECQGLGILHNEKQVRSVGDSEKKRFFLKAPEKYQH